MADKNQGGKHLRKAIKRRMLDRNEMSVTALAAQLGHDVAVISKAINHGQFPRVRAKIREVLGV